MKPVASTPGVAGAVLRWQRKPRSVLRLFQLNLEIQMNTSVTSSNVISSDKVEGTTVYNEAGDKLGSIDDLMIDKLSGHVRYAVLEFGGFLGMGTDRYPLPWHLLTYDVAMEGYVVPLDKDRLEDAPKYTKDMTPIYTHEYGERVTAYYGG
jgi:sporulation protein YlmC with PRC-barrel domain